MTVGLFWVMMSESMRQNKDRQSGMSTIELLILAAVMFALVAVFQVLQSRSDKDRRDLQRLTLMREAQTMFSKIYLASGSYKPAASGCKAKGDLLSDCVFPGEGAGERFRDPGKLAFTVETVPSDETYTIAFTLERAHGTLAAGRHVLTPEGIK